MEVPVESRLTYSSYLKVNDLLALQKPLTPAHDELLFIVIHQVYELWFKQILFELDDVTLLLKKPDFIRSIRRLERVAEIMRVLISQVDVLETMMPIEFNRFRAHLNPASGFQSLQFRELELLCGMDPAEYTKFLELNPEWKGKLEARLRKPTLRDAFFAVIQTLGEESLSQGVLKIYEHKSPDSPLRSLCEGLIKFDEQVELWRFRHVQMVERMIGMKMGTGGSLGVGYLRTTLKKRFFPELWEARTQMSNYSHSMVAGGLEETS
jgi:tryptophan 2,3-dioxygenase